MKRIWHGRPSHVPEHLYGGGAHLLPTHNSRVCSEPCQSRKGEHSKSWNIHHDEKIGWCGFPMCCGRQNKDLHVSDLGQKVAHNNFGLPYPPFCKMKRCDWQLSNKREGAITRRWTSKVRTLSSWFCSSLMISRWGCYFLWSQNCILFVGSQGCIRCTNGIEEED